jgi:hypothetical protein
MLAAHHAAVASLPGATDVSTVAALHKSGARNREPHGTAAWHRIGTSVGRLRPSGRPTPWGITRAQPQGMS